MKISPILVAVAAFLLTGIVNMESALSASATVQWTPIVKGPKGVTSKPVTVGADIKVQHPKGRRDTNPPPPITIGADWPFTGGSSAPTISSLLSHLLGKGLNDKLGGDHGIQVFMSPDGKSFFASDSGNPDKPRIVGYSTKISGDGRSEVDWEATGFVQGKPLPWDKDFSLKGIRLGVGPYNDQLIIGILHVRCAGLSMGPQGQTIVTKSINILIHQGMEGDKIANALKNTMELNGWSAEINPDDPSVLVVKGLPDDVRVSAFTFRFEKLLMESDPTVDESDSYEFEVVWGVENPGAGKNK